MSGEYWNKITEEMAGIAEENKVREIKKYREAERDRLDLENKMILQEKEWKERDRLLREKRAKVQMAESLVAQIFNEIMLENPEIKSSPCKEIERRNNIDLVHPEFDVLLRWGAKFKLTSEEQAIIDKYYVKPWNPISERLINPRIPQTIIEKKWKAIKMSGDKNSVGYIYGTPRVPLDDFIDNPSLLIPSIANELLRSEWHIDRLYKGEAYWRAARPSTGGYSEPWPGY